MSEDSFLKELKQSSKFKQRSHDTHHNIHVPELALRLNLPNHETPSLPEPNPALDDPFSRSANLSNTSPIHIVYLGNSMLERLKTTGKDTNLGTLSNKANAFNAGCGGDKNENVLYRLEQGLYTLLKSSQESMATAPKTCDIALWILASGTNNLHAKHGFRHPDVASWKVLVETCLRIAPRSRVLACDVFYRKDVKDELVEAGNEMLRDVVREVNLDVEKRRAESGEEGGQESVVWVEARQKIDKGMLVDHVHLNEEGYRVWDEVLWEYVKEVVGVEEQDRGKDA
ncbi:hypothetical protein IQ07DRAFT_586885 [Pyrenochaeta sp. DS3sAY3a]|nr:hypothetical protein IQ07DRAFT_586885 [Pyrenochaeta sp. DS3sAY3a]